jgi:uncharacterized membrane protein
MRRDEFWTAFAWGLIVVICTSLLFGVVILVMNRLEGR